MLKNAWLMLLICRLLEIEKLVANNLSTIYMANIFKGLNSEKKSIQGVMHVRRVRFIPVLRVVSPCPAAGCLKWGSQ